jgi:hypothetical protein
LSSSEGIQRCHDEGNHEAGCRSLGKVQLCDFLGETLGLKILPCGNKTVHEPVPPENDECAE